MVDIDDHAVAAVIALDGGKLCPMADAPGRQ
jgi:hypothetical protein